ncbi:MAG: Ig-like domain-containing protein, partial [Gemmatimonadaceae bacterium]
MHRSRVTLAAAGVLLSLAGGLTCTDLSAPKGGLTRVGIAPAFTREAEGAYQRLAKLAVALDNIRLRLNRADGTSAVDTVVVIPAGAESVTIELDVRVNGAEERFNAVIDLRVGDLVLFSGTQVVIARTTGTSPSVPPIEVEYVGPGATAVDVNVLPGEIAILANETVLFTAVAFDASEQPVPDLLVDWSVRDPAIGSVNAAGLFTPAAGARGSTWVIATLPTDVKDSARVTVSPVPATAVLVSGAGQSGAVGQALSPFVFEVRAADELPVPGVEVSFSVSSGGGQLSLATGTTDGVGRVSVTLTLGTQPGENAVQLLVGDQVLATATAIGGVGLPAALALEGGSPISAQAGQAIAAAHAVRVLDAFENPVPNVQVRLALTPRGSPEVLLQTTATSDQEGRVLLSALGTTQNAGLFDIHATVVEPAGITPIVVPVELVA